MQEKVRKRGREREYKKRERERENEIKRDKILIISYASLTIT